MSIGFISRYLEMFTSNYVVAKIYSEKNSKSAATVKICANTRGTYMCTCNTNYTVRIDDLALHILTLAKFQRSANSSPIPNDYPLKS